MKIKLDKYGNTLGDWVLTVLVWAGVFIVVVYAATGGW